MLEPLKSVAKKVFPIDDLRRVAGWASKKDLHAYRSFLAARHLPLSFLGRLGMIGRLNWISLKVPCAHTQNEMLQCMQAILESSGSGGVAVEAGCFKGGSTAKFSLAAALANKQLVVFDSFEGLPDNTERHVATIFGEPISFDQGRYTGKLDEVKDNISRYGRIDHCRFVKGWLEDTLPHFREAVSVIYLDVDLVSSTRTCLKYLYPLLRPGGVLFSQDGHIPLVIELLESDEFWQNELGCRKPTIHGLGKNKLVKIIKGA